MHKLTFLSLYHVTEWLSRDCSGGDLHYHLTQRNSFTEAETRFYAAEVILGLEHMHNRSIVYRDLKVGRFLVIQLFFTPQLILLVGEGFINVIINRLDKMFSCEYSSDIISRVFNSYITCF